MCTLARLAAGLLFVLVPLASCESVKERERTLTEQCKQDAPCKKQGLCTGLCSPEPCRCVVGSTTDCAQSELCSAKGECSAAGGKCVVASNADCTRSAPCRATGLCTAKDGVCMAGTDADCAASDLCKNQHKCAVRNGACVDPSFHPALLNPALTNEQTPEKFRVRFTTSQGDFVVEVTRAWGAFGAERLYNLAKIGYFNNVAFHKVDGDGVQFGIHGNPEVSAAWREVMIRDDAPKQPNDRGYVAFTKTGPHTRWAPLVIHLKNNRSLDQVGYAPIGKVVEGMNVLDALAKTAGLAAAQPDPVKLQSMGDGYLRASFPQVELIKGVSVQ